MLVGLCAEPVNRTFPKDTAIYNQRFVLRIVVENKQPGRFHSLHAPVRKHL
jgi:hypothetical protein